MIKNLSRRYNRARQSQITGEIMEILGGVEALKAIKFRQAHGLNADGARHSRTITTSNSSSSHRNHHGDR